MHGRWFQIHIFNGMQFLNDGIAGLSNQGSLLCHKGDENIFLDRNLAASVTGISEHLSGYLPTWTALAQ